MHMVTVSSNRILRAATYVEKGGVGKTTTSAHVAVAAVREHDLDVVLIDLAGKQNDLSTHFGMNDEVEDLDAPISAIFGEDWGFIRDNIPDVVDRMVHDTGEGIDLIPADPGLGGADNNLANVPVEERFSKLDEFITQDLSDRYDFVLLDLPGKEDNIALNGLFAARNVIAPLKPGVFERNQLENLRADLDDLHEEHPIDPRLVMVIPTMVKSSTNLSKKFVAELQEAYLGQAAPVPVPNSQDISKKQNEGCTLFAVPEDELYNTGQRVLEAYRENTIELLNRLTETNEPRQSRKAPPEQ